MSEIKPEHRRAAAEAMFQARVFYRSDVEVVASWIESGERAPLLQTRDLACPVLHYSAQAIADAEERGRQTGRQQHLELTRRFVRALTVLSQDKPEHWSALREECEDVLTQARAALEAK